MSKSKTPKTIGILRQLVASPGVKQLTTREMVQFIRKNHAEVIREEHEALLEMALIKTAGSVANGRLNNVDPNQTELFEEYQLPKRIPLAIQSEDGSRVAFTTIESATLRQLRAYSAASNAPRRKSKKVLEVDRLIEELEPFAKSADQPLSEIWKIKKEAA